MILLRYPHHFVVKEADCKAKQAENERSAETCIKVDIQRSEPQRKPTNQCKPTCRCAKTQNYADKGEFYRLAAQNRLIDLQNTLVSESM